MKKRSRYIPCILIVVMFGFTGMSCAQLAAVAIGSAVVGAADSQLRITADLNTKNGNT